eukprot:jgi/Undpi1/5902/HiC_scaffold_2.g01176.m1
MGARRTFRYPLSSALSAAAAIEATSAASVARLSAAMDASVSDALSAGGGAVSSAVSVGVSGAVSGEILDLMKQAANPREEKNASLETTVASGIRNCVARLWWSRRAGENAERMTWEAFEEAFQADFGEQLSKTLDVLKMHIASRGDDDVVRPHPPTPRLTTAAAVTKARRQKSSRSVPAAIDPPPPPSSSSSSASSSASSSTSSSSTTLSPSSTATASAAATTTAMVGVSLGCCRLCGGSGKGEDRPGGGSGCVGADGTTKWRVNAGRYEELTWTHGGLYEAFQALADPRRVVFSMGVVDDGPPHEGGDGVDGMQDVSPVVVQGLLGLSVQQVCCGGQHAAVLTDCGEIFTWGRGGFGRLGHGNREPADSPKRIEALEGIPCVQVACGFAYTAAVTASGELYTWGAGENGRLGLGDVEDRHTPSRVEGLHSKVKEVYAGSVHSCVLTRQGTVYAFGKHEYTGHGDKEDVLEPRLILTFSGGSEALVRQISVGPGGYHTMALTCQGQVYAWGHNRVAQLGIGNSFTVPRNMEGAYFLPNPQLVESLVGMNIVKVVAGWGHSAALTMDGQLYVCGRNYQGQLGLGSPQGFPQNERGHPFQADFCLIEKLQHLKIRQIACGGEHSVAVSESGEVWSFGAGHKGQLGHESTTREDFPRLVQALKRTRREILHVACGNNCTLVLAGGVAFPSLFERTAAMIRGNSKLWADVESLGLLPPSVVDSLNRTVSE